MAKAIQLGVVTNATSTTITDANAVYQVNSFVGYELYFVAYNQRFTIVSNTATTIAFTGNYTAPIGAIFTIYNQQHNALYYADNAKASADAAASAVANILSASANLSTLRALPTSNGQTIYVQSHTGTTYLGGGYFDCVTGAVPGTYVDNNGTIIVPTGGDGSAAWLREDTGYITPQMFGAIGNGIIDDTAAMTSFFAAVQGGSGFISKSMNILTATGHVISVAGTKLYGEGKLKASNALAHLIEITANDCTIDGIQLEGDGTFSPNKAVPDANRIALIKVQTANNVTVRNCTLTNGHQNFIHYDLCTGGAIENNHLLGGVTTYAAATDTGYQGIRCVSSANITIKGNVVDALGAGRVVEAIYTASGGISIVPNYLIIENNVVNSAWDHGIYCNIGVGCQIVNNKLTTDGSAIVCASAFDTTLAIRYEGNVCTGNMCVAGAGVGASTVGLYLRDSNNTVCSGNVIRGYPTGIQMSPVTYSHANLTINNNIISQNSIYGFSITGVSISAGGLTVKELAHNIITENTVEGIGSITGIGISFSAGAGLIHDNSIMNNSVIFAGDFGIQTQYYDNGKISNNTLNGFSVAGGTNKTGINMVLSTSTRCCGNAIIDNNMLHGISGNNNCVSCVFESNEVLGAATAPAIWRTQQAGHTNTHRGNKTGTDRLTGTATLSASSVTTIANNNINYGVGHTSTVFITPANLTAGTLVGSTKSPIVSAGDFVNKTSFAIRTASGGAAVGGELFNYEIVQ